jgi:uncharacterized membrane protein YhhN
MRRLTKGQFDETVTTRYVALMIHGWPVLCGVAVLVLMGAERQGWPRIRALSKMVAAVSFLAYAVGLGALSLGLGGQALVAGLVLSVVGDACLLSSDKRVFTLGIGAFLWAHVAYIGLFLALGVSGVWTAVGGVAVGLLAMAVGRILSPFVGSLRPAVFAYIAVISVMVAVAIGMGAAEYGPGRDGLLLSAIAFFISDLCVARQRFVVAEWVNKAFGLPLYFGAQLGFVWFGVVALSA